jgi:hypothetical protein
MHRVGKAPIINRTEPPRMEAIAPDPIINNHSEMELEGAASGRTLDAMFGPAVWDALKSIASFIDAWEAKHRTPDDYVFYRLVNSSGIRCDLKQADLRKVREVIEALSIAHAHASPGISPMRSGNGGGNG